MTMKKNELEKRSVSALASASLLERDVKIFIGSMTSPSWD